MKVALRDAKNGLSKLGNRVHNGETVVVTKNGQPWFDLVPHRKKERRTMPMQGVSPTISVEEAIAPLDEKDLPGWM